MKLKFARPCKLPLLIILLITFSAGYGAYLLSTLCRAQKLIYENQIKEHDLKILSFHGLIGSIVDSYGEGELIHLEPWFKERVSEGSISFYRLSKGEGTIYQSSSRYPSFPAGGHPGGPGELVKLPGMSFVRLEREDFIASWGYLWRPHYFMNARGAKIETLLIILHLIVIGLAAGIILKAYFWPLKNMRERQAGTTVSEKGPLKSLDVYRGEFREGLRKLAGQILPRSQSGTHEKKTFPFRLTCTIVSTDINNHTKFLRNPSFEKEFMKTKREFIYKSIELIQNRYNGHVFKFLGDEFIYLFKDDEIINSSNIALSCLSEINRLAERISRKTLGLPHGFIFTVRSSVTYGELNADLYYESIIDFEGEALNLAARISKDIKIKHKNTVVLDDAAAQRINLVLYEPIQTNTVHLRDFGNRKLTHFANMSSLEEMIEDIDDTTLDLLRYYRSEDDLIALIRFLIKRHIMLKPEFLLKLLETLKSFHYETTDTAVKDLYQSLLIIFERSYYETQDYSYVKFLSSAIRWSITLFEKTRFKIKIPTILGVYLNFPNDRVVANTIEAIRYFDAGFGEKRFQGFTGHENNRIRINALVSLAGREVGSKVFRTLSAELRGDSDNRVKAAIYATSHLLNHYENINPEFLDNNKYLRRLFLLVKKISREKNIQIPPRIPGSTIVNYLKEEKREAQKKAA